MRSNEFLNIIHDSSEFFSFAILESSDEMTEFLNEHDIPFHYIDYKTEYEIENSVLLENITFSNLENISEHFSIDNFIYAKKNNMYPLNEVVFEHGKSKYVFELWNKLDGDFIKTASSDFVKIDNSMNEGIIFSDNTVVSIPFFGELDDTYKHRFDRDEIVDGVKESTLKRIREIIL